MKNKLPVQPAYLRGVREKKRQTSPSVPVAYSILGVFVLSIILSTRASLQTGAPFETALILGWGTGGFVAFLIIVIAGLPSIINDLLHSPARLQINQPDDRKSKEAGKQKAKHGIDVTLDAERTYHIRGLGNRTGGRALLDLAGAYMLRYWLSGDTSLNLRCYDMYTQQDRPDWQFTATGTGTVTLDLNDSRYEFIVQAGAEDRHIDPWELELEPVYDHALDEDE